MIMMIILPIKGFAADKIKLYDKPNETANVIKLIDAKSTLIAIYYSRDKEAWVKIAEPTPEGSIGWISLKDFKGKLSLRQFNQNGFFEESSISNDQKGHVSRYYSRSYESDDHMTNKQLEQLEHKQAERMGELFGHLWKRFREMQRLMEDFINNMDKQFNTTDEDLVPESSSSSWWDRLKQSFTDEDRHNH